MSGAKARARSEELQLTAVEQVIEAARTRSGDAL